MQYEIHAYDALYDTKTIAGVMLHAAGTREERYESVD